MGRFGCIFRISPRERQDHVLVMKTIGQIDGNPKADFTELEERRRILGDDRGRAPRRVAPIRLGGGG